MSIAVGDRVPTFTLTDDRGKKVSSADFAGKNLVVYFYPKAFTPGCTTESCDLRDRYQRFVAAGYEIVGISPDPVDRLAEFRKEHRLPFSLLSDPDHKVAAAFGAWGTKRNYGREYQGIIRSTFVIDSTGRVTDAWRNVKAAGHAERVLGAVG